MMQRIKTLSLQAFRGASASLSLNLPDKPLVLILGSNGSGKTTIADSLDFICNGTQGSLHNISGAGASNIPTIGFKQKDMVLQLRTSEGEWILNEQGQKLTRTGNAPLPVVRVLRRHSLIQLTAARPAERYAQMLELIDISGLSAAEESLKKAYNAAARRNENLKTSYTTALKQLEGLWHGTPEEHKREDADALTWARKRIAAPRTELAKRVVELEAEVNHLTRLAEINTELQLAYDELRASRQQLTALDTQLQQQTESLNAQLVEALTKIESYLPQQKENFCPLCQQAINLEQLQQNLASRLAQAQHVQSLNTQRQELGQQQLLAQDRVTRALEQMRTLSQLEVHQRLAHVGPAVLEGKRQELADLRMQLESHMALTQLLRSLDEWRVEGKKVESQEDTLGRVLQIMQRERKAALQRFFDEIEAEAAQMYSRVHPDEELGFAGVHLSSTKAGSLELGAHFYSAHNISPQKYFSESHLDTFGFCFWLAFVKRSSPGAIVVLDDVFGTLDIVHVARINRLLLSEAERGSFGQIIVTTNLKSWANSLRQNYSHLAAVIELGEWALDTGITVLPAATP